MRTSLIALSVMTLCVASNAQNGNRVLSDNQPYYVISSATAPSTGRNRIWPPTQPAEFSNGTGVAAGTKTFKLFENHVYHRLADSDAGTIVQLDGYTQIIRLSAVTAAGAAGIGREPQNELRVAVPDPNSAGDFIPGPAVLHTIASQAGTSTGTTFRVTRNFPFVSITYAGGPTTLTTDFAGGEETNTVATAAQPSQGTVGSWQNGETNGPGGVGASAYGFDYTGTSTGTDPNGNTHVQRRAITGSNQFYPWATVTTNQPSGAIHSDYGQRRIAPLTPPLLGHSLGSYYSDIATNTAGINIGYSIRAGATFANGQAIPLINIGPASFPGAIPIPVIPGSTVDLFLNPGDPTFGILASSFSQVLDGNGEVDSATIALGQQAPLLGFTWDWQWVLVDSALSIVDNTERRGVLLN